MNIDVASILNDIIKDADNLLGLTGEAKPPIFIVGAPRSGTTILNQMLAAFTDCGYIDNLSASFWNAPAIGVLLSKKLIKKRVFTGKSHFGRTSDISEPHEFGMFWRTHLNYQDMVQMPEGHAIDWNNLIDALNRIAIAWNASTVFKVFQLTWHIKELKQYLPEARWLWITRDLIDNALSLLKSRQSRFGCINQNYSSLPLAAKECSSKRSPFHQVVAQVFFINQWLENELKLHYPGQYLKFDLSSLCATPSQKLKESADFCTLNLNLEELQFVKAQQSQLANYHPDWIAGVDNAINDFIIEGVLHF